MVPKLIRFYLFSLHHNLIEHLNAEVVLHTITDVSIALEWLRSTFFYVRVKQNPQHYGEDIAIDYSDMSLYALVQEFLP